MLILEALWVLSQKPEAQDKALTAFTETIDDILSYLPLRADGKWKMENRIAPYFPS